MIKFCKLVILFLNFFLLFLLQSQSFSIKVTFSFVGDVMFHKAILDAAYSNGKYAFKSFFEYVKPYIEKSDVASCNLETTLGGKPYTGYPRFSTPDEALDALKYAGFDVINIANNHMLDRGVSGLKRTITKIAGQNLTCVGARLTPVEKPYRVIEVKGLKISFASFTYATNGLSVDKDHRYMFMYISEPAIISMINEMKKESDIVIVYFHYGNEYQTTPTKKQIELAHLALDYGADMVIASHPHVLQRIELVKYGQKTKLIAYSLGNFISNMTSPGTDEGVILNITYHPVRGVISVNPILTWVHRCRVKDKLLFRVLPVKRFLENPDKYLTESDLKRLSQIAGKKLIEERERK
ncbi:MAG: CapA family protein [Thermotogaceae bacterium]|nr:CapA family protein [Thermotogaceae bacterium]